MATECLEHSLEPLNLVKELARVSYTTIVSVPLNENLINDPLNNGSGHLHSFTVESFKELFKDFEILDIEIHSSGKFLVALILNIEK